MASSGSFGRACPRNRHRCRREPRVDQRPQRYGQHVRRQAVRGRDLRTVADVTFAYRRRSSTCCRTVDAIRGLGHERRLRARRRRSLHRRRAPRRRGSAVLTECRRVRGCLVHDTLNERVRTGLETIDYGRYEKVTFVDLDFLPGQVFRRGPWKGEHWCRLGLLVTGRAIEGQPWPETYAMPDVCEAFAGALAAGAPHPPRRRALRSPRHSSKRSGT